MKFCIGLFKHATYAWKFHSIYADGHGTAFFCRSEAEMLLLTVGVGANRSGCVKGGVVSRGVRRAETGRRLATGRIQSATPQQWTHTFRARNTGSHYHRICNTNVGNNGTFVFQKPAAFCPQFTAASIYLILQVIYINAVWTSRQIPTFQGGGVLSPSPKRWYTRTSPHRVITQKINIVTAVWASNLT
jgi:hypothetical protein